MQTISTFHNGIIKELYLYDYSINQSILKQIIDLGDKAIPDLELVLMDIIKHDLYYSNQEDCNYYTHDHALYLLGELGAEQSLPKILNLFSQDEDFLDFWFGDSLNEEMWKIIYKCGQNSLDLIEFFLKDQKVPLYAPTAVSSGLLQIGLHNPDKQVEIFVVYKRVIEATIPFVRYKENSRGDWTEVWAKKDDAKDAIAFYVCDLLDFEEPTFKNYLHSLFDQGVVEETIVDRQSIDEESPIEHMREIKSIFDRYDEMERIYKHIEEQEAQLVFPIKRVKLGRNEKCWCRSGKKCKKCHLYKE